MKKIKYIISIFFIAVMLISCEDDLAVSPETSFSEVQVFGTEEGVESVVNGMWVTYGLGDYHGNAYHNLLNPHSGMFHFKKSSSSVNADATSLDLFPNNIWLDQLWSGMWKPISNANVIIANLEGKKLELENHDIALGQAYLVRAMVYFELVQMFGDVPLRLKPTTKNDIHLARSPKEDVYTQIIADLENAKTMLPDVGEYRSERPLKYAANVILAKVYMRLAGEDGGDASYWQKAFNEAIVAYGKYELHPSFSDLFEPGVENTSESILEIQYGLYGDDRSNDLARVWTPSNYYLYPKTIRTFGRIAVQKEVFDSHVNQYPGDPRIDATYLYDGYLKNNGKTQKLYPIQKKGNYSFPYIKKYEDPGYNGTTSERNMIKLRYAEVLLMLAEIQNELTAPTDAFKYVAPVLERARNTASAVEPADWDYTTMSKDDFRLRILKERNYELLAEGQQWFDSRRRGYQYLLNEIINVHNNNSTFDSTTDLVQSTDEKSMLIPIPSSEISGNQGISQADQNPGY